MTSGRLVAVVGPSGVGKDSVMAGLVARHPALKLVRRVITREPGPGEDFDAVSVATFERYKSEGRFAMSWGAHGLFYGIPVENLTAVRSGEERLANLSRKMLSVADAVFGNLTVLSLTARADTLAARLAARGRETAEDIAQRLSRSADLPEGLNVIEISNDGALEDTLRVASAALYPASVR